MFGTLLYLVSTSLLAAWCFTGQRPATRLAAAVLVALGLPIFLLSVAARVGVEASLGLVIGAHALLWVLAAVCRKGRSRAAEGSVLPAAFVAAVVTLLTSLLGPDPADVVLVDAWAHLGWSRRLAASVDAYARGFPALLATLTPFDPLVGAFRASTWLLHFSVATQFLALGNTRRAGGLTAFAALAYLLVPAAGTRFEIPGPELASAVFLSGMWWVASAGDLSGRARAGALGVLAMLVILCHVSALQIALFSALGLALLCGVGGLGTRERLAPIVALGLGSVIAAALSPSFLALVFAPESVALVAMQAGAVEAIGLRPFVAGLGLTLGGLLVVGAGGFLRRARSVATPTCVLVGGLLVGALLLLAPIVLVRFGIEVPLQLFTSRLLMAAALPLSLLAAVLLEHGDFTARARDRGLVLATGVLLLTQGARPMAPPEQLGLALLAGGLALLAVRKVAWRGWPLVTSLAIALVVASRLWIWAPQVYPHVQWLRQAPAELTVLTNWPVTNELDALVSLTVLDGLAGRDANLALHRTSFTTALRDRLAWCGEGDEVQQLQDYLLSTGTTACYLVVDDRFEKAWDAYQAQRADLAVGSTEGASALMSAEPCPLPALERMSAMRAAIHVWPSAELVFESPGVSIHRVQLTPER